ncbi:von Willebrand factor-like [Spea bombifrons]|uniref:von Willebrand factor-like n=1 Tax=Spea bombifrons TaxID=233779 RepID=UPI002349ADD8|nr:von Willebrand factor-like [Spea bombifrons]
MARWNTQIFARLLMLGLSMSWFYHTEAVPTAVPCPPNTVYGCMRQCYSNCDNLNSTYEACIEICKLGCDCPEGYVFQSKDSKVCVPVSECAVSCPEGMDFIPCYRFPLQTCDTLGIHYVPSRYCRPRCVCKEGYVLSNDPKPHCIKKTLCPNYLKPTV